MTTYNKKFRVKHGLVSDGNVGIGTDSPTEALSIKSDDGLVSTTSNVAKTAGVLTGGYLIYSGDGSGAGAGNRAGIQSFTTNSVGSIYDLRFYTSNGSTNLVEAMRIDGSGKVGINRTTINAALHIGAATPVLRMTDSDTDRSAQIVAVDGSLRFDADNENAQSDTTISFKIDNSERMRITSAGKVGIGITSFDEGVLHVKSDDAGEVELLTLENSTGTNGKTTLTFKTTSTDATKSAQIFAERINASGHTDLAFRTFNGSANERMRLTSTGGFRLGTNSNQLYDTTSQTGVVLHDTHSYSSCGAHIEIANAAGQGWSPVYIQRFGWSAGVDGRFLQFAINGSADVGNITYDGTNFSVTNSSDYRLKENIVDYTGGLTKINALKVRSFNKKEGASKDITQQGFIAHELAEHIPNAVIGTKDAMKVDETGKTVPDYQQVTREALVPYLVSAIQEQQTIIDDLKARIETLEE